MTDSMLKDMATTCLALALRIVCADPENVTFRDADEAAALLPREIGEWLRDRVLARHDRFSDLPARTLVQEFKTFKAPYL